MRRPRKLGGKARHVNHGISKQIVASAKGTGRGIALEELKGIRERAKVGRAQRAVLHSWAFAQLRSFVEYKAKPAERGSRLLAGRRAKPPAFSRQVVYLGCIFCVLAIHDINSANSKARDARYGCILVAKRRMLSGNMIAIVHRRLDEPRDRVETLLGIPGRKVFLFDSRRSELALKSTIEAHDRHFEPLYGALWGNSTRFRAAHALTSISTVSRIDRDRSQKKMLIFQGNGNASTTNGVCTFNRRCGLGGTI